MPAEKKYTAVPWKAVWYWWRINMRRLWILFLILLALLLLPYSLKASGFEASTASLFSDIRANQIGDIITVNIYENAQATAQNQTKADKTAQHELNAGPGVGSFDFIPLFGVSGENTSTYDGKGQQIRSNNLRARMTVRVVAIRPNGDLVVEGSRVIGLNSDKEVLTLTGIIRSQDINSDNSVDSYNLADAQITYQGKGAASTAGRPGILTRVLNFVF
jgi:flagellar L-ring protein FlgH